MLVRSLLGRILLGVGGGAGLGAVYGALGRCDHGQCALEWSPVPSILTGAALGLFVVLTSRWD